MKKKAISLFVFSFFLFLMINNVRADTYEISNCSVLDIEGATYLLTDDIINYNEANGICINIIANNTIFDCQGHTIDGNVDSSVINGFIINGNNITIKNCVITDFIEAIKNMGYSNNTIINVSIDFTEGFGTYGFYVYSDEPLYNINIINVNISHIYTAISFFGGNRIYNSTLANINTSYNSNCIQFVSVSNTTIINLTCKNNTGDGIYFSYSYDNVIINSIISENGDNGIYLEISYNNTIYNNLFNNTNNVFIYFNEYIDYEYYINKWNTIKKKGQRIYSNGNYIGGNYWTNPTGTGYSDTCEDEDEDGFCDQPYILAEYNVDYFAYSNKYEGYEEPEQPPQKKKKLREELPEIVGRMVFDTGFAILGLFTILTLVLYSYEDLKNDPKKFIEIMIGIAIIVLLLTNIFMM